MTKIYNKNSQKLNRQNLRRQMPKAEVILWIRLRRRQIAGVKFRRQYSVARFVLDFYCPELKLAIEIDGPTHYSAEAKGRIQVLWDPLQIRKKGWDNNPAPNKKLSHDCIVY
ncbi:DUF559 domain-containing protein [Leptolyngbyaceae cyanobacterium CCMR0082]|uniref:DUF559 domain-containing protein n=1 Tax=Adonisia turfae CCMR0082 TaxID=2304604 RepID=A0A6M0S9E1_9CYAN|nr:DUF559 domain-containing protein [Adonisia turfae]NEZ65094.1 DUF559 domain-containing protein [Adonisia turfae CCMR0082]